MSKLIFTADDEEPKCGCCDHCWSDYKTFCEKCGPEYWWANYRRTEIIEEEVTNVTKPAWRL